VADATAADVLEYCPESGAYRTRLISKWRGRMLLTPAAPDHNAPWREGYAMAASHPTRLDTRAQDLTGRVFGLLQVESFAGRPDGKHLLWSCRCQCGGRLTTRADLLTRGCAVSCGCRQSVLRRPRLFWDRVTKCDNGCWEWCGGTKGPYGVCRVRGRPVRAHRVSYELHFGPVPSSLCVCHRCDNPICVRPDHLFLGTNLDNVADKVAKGRQVRGVSVNTAKLTPEAVRRIRDEYRDGVSASTLATRYGISDRCILRIVRREAWKHV
jgi:hypothetical protein